MDNDESKKYLDKILSEIEAINGTDPELRLKLLDLSHKILQKVKDLRELKDNIEPGLQ